MGEDAAPSYRLYSRWHIELTTLLSTPVGGALLFRVNFRRLGHPRLGRWTVLLSTAGTTALILTAVFAAGRGVPHLALFLFLQLTYLCGVHAVFKLYMKGPLRAHRAAGGKTGPWGGALLAAIGGLAILLVTLLGIGILTMLGPTSINDKMNNCVTITRRALNRERVCFMEGATEADARELGKELHRLGVFRADGELRQVQIGRPSGTRVISLVESRDFERQNYARTFSDAGEAMARTIYRGQPFELRLCRQSSCKAAKTVLVFK